VYQQRREALKSIPKFWPVALLKHSLFALQAQHDADRLALSYLEDVWVVRDPREPKVFTLEFVRPFCDNWNRLDTELGLPSTSKKIPISATRC
jgi:Nucleosome assembly protein (NAP)